MKDTIARGLLTALPLVLLAGSVNGDSYGVNEERSTHQSDTFQQTVRFQTVDQDPRRVVVENRERAGKADEWTKNELLLTASFQIRDVQTVKADELFVWGHTEGGENVVERWVVRPVKGARTVERSLAPTALGVPRERSQLVERDVGGVWIEPAKRAPGTPWVDRTELYRGGGAALLQVDPDGRYVLLAMAKPPSIVRIDLLQPGPPEVLYTAAEIPGLAQDRYGGCGMSELHPQGWLEPHYHGPGRAFALQVWPPQRLAASDPPVYLVDDDNDGVFETLGPTLPASEPRADGRVPLEPGRR